MRVLHVTKKLPPIMGGDATAVDALARTQRRHGHDVDVVAYRAPGVPEDEHTHLVGRTQSPEGLDRITARRFLAMRELERWGRDHLPTLRPEVIHTHAVDVGLPLARAARPLGIPVVLTCHGVWFPARSRFSFAGWLERSLIRRGGYAAITSVDASSVRELRGAGFPHAVEIPNGVDLDEFPPPPAREGPFVFLCVGRHVAQKAVDVLIRATADARSRVPDGFTVEIVGQGPLTDSLRELAAREGVAEAVRFLGTLPRPELLAAYARAHAFVLSSRHEGFPVTILEAWASGLPVLATAVGGIPEVCTDENAILVPPEDPSALADGMVALLRDAPRRESLARAGRSLVTQRYTWDAVSARYEDLYARLRRSPGGTP